jgi:hypothetical protein
MREIRKYPFKLQFSRLAKTPSTYDSLSLAIFQSELYLRDKKVDKVPCNFMGVFRFILDPAY